MVCGAGEGISGEHETRRASVVRGSAFLFDAKIETHCSLITVTACQSVFASLAICTHGLVVHTRREDATSLCQMEDIYVICSVYVVEDAHRTEKIMSCGFRVADLYYWRQASFQAQPPAMSIWRTINIHG